MGRGKIVARMVAGGSIKQSYDATANDSDKSFTVPANKRWKTISIFVSCASFATVGNRRLRVTVNDGTNDVGVVGVNYNQTASNTILYELWETAYAQVSASPMSWPLPAMILPAGWVIRVYDSAAIDPAADDMTVAIQYEEFDV